MKCPDCVEGKVTLLFDVVPCTECGGTSVLRTEEPNTLFKPRFNGKEFSDPRSLDATFQYEGEYGHIVKDENYLFAAAFGEFKEIQIHETSWDCDKDEFEINGHVDGPKRFRMTGDGPSTPVVDMLNNFTFVQSKWYGTARENGNILCTMLANLHGGAFEQHSIDQHTMSAWGDRFIVPWDTGICNLDDPLNRLANQIVRSMDNPRGRCFAEESYERDNGIGVRTQYLGYELLCHHEYLPIQRKIQIGVTFVA